MMVVATVMFMGVMFLSFEKNDEGKWEFTTSALAQSGEGGDEEPPCAPGTEKGYSSWMTVAGPYVVRDPIHPMIWYEC